MRVRIYAVDQTTGVETLEATAVDLSECFPDRDDPERLEAQNELERAGRVRIGGGAAQLFLLTREG